MTPAVGENGHVLTGHRESFDSLYSAIDWKALLMAVLFSFCIFVTLPFLEFASSFLPDKGTMREVETVAAPVQIPERIRKNGEQEMEKKLPKPKLSRKKLPFVPSVGSLDLSYDSGSLNGDYSLDFEVGVLASGSLQVDDIIYEISDLDSPPRAISRFQPRYPVHAKSRGIKGNVVLEFVIKKDGKVGQVKTISSKPGKIFVFSAQQAVQRWVFYPVKKNGEIVRVKVRQTISFQ